MKEKIANIICEGSPIAEELADQILKAVIEEIRAERNPHQRNWWDVRLDLGKQGAFEEARQAIIKKLEAK